MDDYYICLVLNASRKTVIGPVTLEYIDNNTTNFSNQEDLVDYYINKLHICTNCKIEEVEKVVIVKENQYHSWTLGEVFYAEDKKVTNKDKNKEELIEKSKDREFLTRFFGKYIVMANKERGVVPNEKKINAFLVSMMDLDEMEYDTQSKELLDEMLKNYGIYRFMYSVNKSLGMEEIEKPKIKCKTSSVGTIGRRIKKTH